MNQVYFHTLEEKFGMTSTSSRHNPFTNQVCFLGEAYEKLGQSGTSGCIEQARCDPDRTLQHEFALPKAKACLLADMDMVRKVKIVREGAHRAAIDDAPRQSSKLHEGLLPSGISAPVFPAEAVLLYADTVRALEDRGEDVFRQAV